ncbi:hypothetical protein BKA64DRAFT_655956 [Cadophora sp. MPI-SDFR-AT-0126]|nr:hypothetical protein BKA64DRAFT_655956 [Leotiomycetes sp. MPI-SDFR-AT-0126]
MQRKPVPPRVHSTEYMPNAASPEIDISNYQDGFSPVEDTAHRPENKEASHVTDSFLGGEISSSPSIRTAKWGISWLGEPLQLPLFTLLGIGLAIAHHLIYRALDGKVVGDSEIGQQAVKQVGNVFVFLVLACLKVAIDESYNQYMWYTIRRKSFAIDTLDKLFTLPVRIMSILSLRLLGGAKIAAVLGLLSWLLFLGGLTPATTLSIVPALQNSTSFHLMPVPDYNTSSWWQIQTINTDPTIDPTAIHLKTAVSSALRGAIIPPLAPSANSSFNVQFYGPSIQCEDPDAGQTAAFKEYERVFFDVHRIVTTGSIANSSDKGVSGFLIMSSFSPTQNAPDEPYRREDLLKNYNNWQAELTPEYLDFRGKAYNGSQQLWVQTADRNIVCSLVNASFDVGFEYIGGVGKVTHQHVQVLPPVAPSNTTALLIPYGNATLGGGASLENNQNSAYYASFLALGYNIYGNVSLENMTTKIQEEFIQLSQASSRILLTDLAACDEFADSYWARNLDFNTSRIFPREPWMCRNKTIDLALEDLANNITISMLSVDGMTSKVRVPVRIGTTSNVYSYDQNNLLISYGATIFVALICVIVGVASLIENGIYHRTTFSTVMATTRNPDLDVLANGACLGTGQAMMKEKVMFGVLAGATGGSTRDTAERGENSDGNLQHAAFGLTGTVTKIRKGTPCS